jgi:hypothetical protein
MQRYKYKVELVVEIEAFDGNDAWEALQDNFGIGDTGDLTVTDFEAWEVANGS